MTTASHSAAPAPLELHRERIRPEWIDYNGHMNVSYYVLVFDHATDQFLDFAGMGEAFRRDRQASSFTAEMHVNYLREVKEGDEVSVSTILLGYDEKRIHYFHQMRHAEEGYLAATNELLGLYVDMNLRRVAPMPPEILDRLAAIRQSHAALPVPEQMGSVMGVKSK